MLTNGFVALTGKPSNRAECSPLCNAQNMVLQSPVRIQAMVEIFGLKKPDTLI